VQGSFKKKIASFSLKSYIFSLILNYLDYCSESSYWFGLNLVVVVVCDLTSACLVAKANAKSSSESSNIASEFSLLYATGDKLYPPITPTHNKKRNER
jgi:hypothetical protein